MRSMMVYSQDGCGLPKSDERIGRGYATFLLTPSKDHGYATIKEEFLKYKKSLYRHYLIDFIYKDRLGFKKVLLNKTGEFKKEFANNKDMLNGLTAILNSNKASILKQRYNVLVNLGQWHELYFQYQMKGSVEKICENYFIFLQNRIYSNDFHNYQKIMYIDIDQWITESNPLGFGRSKLNNPISIFLVAMRSFPALFNILNSGDIIFASPSREKVMRISIDDANDKNYPKIKQKIMSMIPDENVNNSDIIDKGFPITVDEVVSDIVDKKEETVHQAMMKSKILASLTKELLGDTSDITENLDYDESGGTDQNDNADIYTEDEKINEIKGIAEKYLDDHPELLTTDDVTTAEKEVKDAVKKRYYIREYTPKYTDKQLKEIHRLMEAQVDAIGDIDISLKDMESKIIDESDVSEVTDTHNPNIIRTKFNKFDHSYVTKKLSQDIDNMVGHLANANTKVFIVDKEEEDSSTQMDLKKTVTYHLQDEKGKKMTLKFDLPVIFDDHFMYIKGNKKILQHQFVLKPIVKIGKSVVQIATTYKKMRISRSGSMEFKTNALLKYLLSNKGQYNVVDGNAYSVNAKYKTNLEYDIVSKKITRFLINEKLFILNIDQCIDELTSNKIKYDDIDMNDTIIIGIDTINKKPITLSNAESFCDFVINEFSDEEKEDVRKLAIKTNGSKKLTFTEGKILSKSCPLILLLLYFEGFDIVMSKADIEYELIRKIDGKPEKNIDLYEWGLTELEDGYIKWKRYPTENSMLMNGLNALPMYLYGMEELNSKNTYMYLMTNIHAYANQAFNLDQFYDFMIDPITKEILIDMKLPTDLVSLCLLGNKMLKVNEYSQESDLNNVRLRSAEVIPYHCYQAITEAYHKYRTTQHRGKVVPITIKKDAIIKRLLKQPASVMTDASINHPVMDASKLHSVTYKGEGGLNDERSYNMGIRAYNDSMLGICGITTTNDSNVGVTRQLTMEPSITSTRGYLDVGGTENLDKMNSSNLLTPMEMLTPLGIQHDDPTRSTMAFKQTTHMVSTEQSDPVLIGNGVEKVIPYHISSEFTVVAEEDGVIVDKNDSFIVIQYSNGRYRSIDLTPQVKKNSDAGIYVVKQFATDKNIGDKISKNEIVAWDPKEFSRDWNSKGCSMKLGPLVKVALIPEWDGYEDSAPISSNASKKMTSTVVMPVEVSLKKDAFISQIAKVGDKIEAGSSVIRYDDYREDPDIAEYIQSLREELQEDIIENNQTTEKTHYTGTVIDIQIVTAVQLDEMSDSVRKVVSNYWKKIKKKNSTLEKYSNSDDLKYYKSGNLITRSPEPIDVDYTGKIKGHQMDDGVLITFFIAYDDVMSRGDKLASEFALKSIASHVIDSGLEARSEWQPEKPIDLIIPPLSVTARKTPSIFLAMFGNKLLIGGYDHIRDYWENN